MAGRKMGPKALTPLEFQIMQVLWREGPSNVRQVQRNLSELDLAYTTVQSMLNVLQRKGRVRRALKDVPSTTPLWFQKRWSWSKPYATLSNGCLEDPPKS